MSNILNIKTPSEGQATSIRGDYGLDNLGLTNLRKAYWNLPTEALYEESVFRGEANITRM
jgi:phosphoenolpyruvate carboxykinase (ATP)